MATFFTDDAKKEIGDKLKKVRESLHLSQSKVAFFAEVSPNYYARIERGEENFTIEVLLGLAKTLKIKPEEILAPIF